MCGGGRIRTSDAVSHIPVFETGAFDHSATPPLSAILAFQHENDKVLRRPYRPCLRRQVTVRTKPMFYLYLIKSTRYDWVYVGSTSDLENRLREHNTGAVRSTKFRRPYILIHSETFDNMRDARRREKNIKTNRIEKESIVRKYGPIV